MLTSVVTRLLPALLALVSAFLTISVGLWLAGISVATVFSALLTGAAGDTYRLAETAVKACPLLLTGLAVAVALHAGVWNIGAEGQLLLGALAAAWVSQYTVSLPPLWPWTGQLRRQRHQRRGRHQHDADHGGGVERRRD